MTEQPRLRPRVGSGLGRRGLLALAGAAALSACGPGALKLGGGRLQTKRLDQSFPALAERARPGLFALGVMDLQTADTWYWNTDRAFPLAAAAAAPIAVAVLAQLDKGRLTLADRVAFHAEDLAAPPSVIDAAWPAASTGETMPVANLLALALQRDDGTAADILMQRIGGPGAVTAWLHDKGVTGISVDRYARERDVAMFGMPSFQPAWRDQRAFDDARDQIAPSARQAAMDAYIADPRDGATCPAALGFLAQLAGGDLLSAASMRLLLGWMAGAATGPARFSAGLPAGAALAYVSGETPSDLGYTPAAAELAIATLPNKKRYALAGFLAGSTASKLERDKLFADAARLAAQAIG
ncbi:MAG TPA: serine hydrolase [Caulobacteraceae bacterium]|jgi:beta-lactamase class A